MPRTSIFDMPFSKVYEALVNKAVKKGRTRAEVGEITCWITGYSNLEELGNKTYGEFITEAPSWNTRAELITGLRRAGGEDRRSDDEEGAAA